MVRLLLLVVLSAAASRAQPLPDGTFGDAGFARVDRVRDVFTLALTVGTSGELTLSSSTQVTYGGLALRTTLSRLTAAGQPDTLFAPGGTRVVAPPAAFAEVILNSLGVLPDGRLAVAGQVGGPSGSDAPRRAVVGVRLADGRPDSTFGQGGFVVLETPGVHASNAYSVVEVEGELVVAGEEWSTVGSGGFVARFALDGSPVLGFGTAGRTRIAAGEDTVILFDVAAFPDGRLIAVGLTFRRPAFHWDALVVRLTPDGQLEPENGIVARDVFERSSDYALRVTPLPDGRALIAGRTLRATGGNVSTSGTTLFRVLPDGTPDPSYGSDGWTWTDALVASSTQATDGDEWPGRPFVLPDGRIGVSAGSTAYGSLGAAVVLQLQDGSPDRAAGLGGVARLFVDRPNLTMTLSTLATDGTLVLAGTQLDDTFVPVAARVVLPSAVRSEPVDARIRGLTVAPNPTSHAARVMLDLDAAVDARVTVLDALGRTVAVLHDGPLAAGETPLTLDTDRLPAGVYAVVVQAGVQRQTARVTVVR